MSNPYGEWVPDPLAPSGFRWRRHDEYPATEMLPTVPRPRPRPYPDPGLDVANSNSPAQTAGEQDHSNPWFYAGDDADPPGAA